MTDQDFKTAVSEYIDIMVNHLTQIAKQEGVPTDRKDILEVINFLTRMKIEGVE